jgi:hypothetical protein
MFERQPLAPNNRSIGKLMSEFSVSEAVYIRPIKTNGRQTAFSYARAGRQNSEGFGGGNRVMKK